MATATTKNRCQPIITASGGRPALSGRCMIQPKVSADHYRVGGALAIIVSSGTMIGHTCQPIITASGGAHRSEW